jgi:hypothetical protein
MNKLEAYKNARAKQVAYNAALLNFSDANGVVFVNGEIGDFQLRYCHYVIAGQFGAMPENVVIDTTSSDFKLVKLAESEYIVACHVLAEFGRELDAIELAENLPDTFERFESEVNA